MFNPVPPQEPDSPRRTEPREPFGPIDDDRLDIRRRDFRGDDDLTAIDWLLCIFCSGIGCIVGIVRLMQGKPNAGKMIGISFIFAVIWGFVRVLMEAALKQH